MQATLRQACVEQGTAKLGTTVLTQVDRLGSKLRDPLNHFEVCLLEASFFKKIKRVLWLGIDHISKDSRKDSMSVLPVNVFPFVTSWSINRTHSFPGLPSSFSDIQKVQSWSLVDDNVPLDRSPCLDYCADSGLCLSWSALKRRASRVRLSSLLLGFACGVHRLKASWRAELRTKGAKATTR